MQTIIRLVPAEPEAGRRGPVQDAEAGGAVYAEAALDVYLVGLSETHPSTTAVGSRTERLLQGCRVIYRPASARIDI